jgi:preprotein translocase subunit YajC
MHMNFFSAMLADATPAAVPAATTTATGSPAAPPPQNFAMQMAPMILIFVVFYFLLIRPQQQRAKQQQKLLAGLKAGDKVVTASGIIGVVTSVRDDAVSLRSADAKFEVTKSSVTEIREAAVATQS